MASGIVKSLGYAAALLALTACSRVSKPNAEPWLLIDNFESSDSLDGWTNADVQNDTNPRIENPQISELRGGENHHMIRKPAADGITGNRKAIGFTPLPVPIQVGQTYTVYTRINVEYFPNNQSFGLSNLSADEILDKNYDAFEPMIRVTDKTESDGTKNDGTLMVLSGYKTYSKITNPITDADAEPMNAGTWYELWWVVNNAPLSEGGQSYDLYVRGGEFETQQAVFKGAVFRMKREASLGHFMALSNTGPLKDPYGNGGVRYDDIYMAPGAVLTSPL